MRDLQRKIDEEAVQSRALYISLYIYIYIDLYIDIHIPFSTVEGWVFSILVWISPVVGVSVSRETRIVEQVVHLVSRVYIYILHESVVNGLNKLQGRYSGRGNLRVTEFGALPP